ncbi:hypothetical protein EUGRSUZ_A01967 [Eucalyptus grandis]|uniref:Uncharacterized protein n=3 Tax=Eucalyptus grandis TaxID=71139 RepID=A0ACC3M666_EUCGR|nr:hypothetical protein EUGRSUZ_A01967 [Eucalyptus grandis]
MSSPRLFPIVLLSLFLCLVSATAGNFYQDIDVLFGDWRTQILQGGELITLSLDKASGAGFRSKNEYLYGRFDMRMKLVGGDSAGTVTTFYMSSQGPTHNEIDLEFLGNSSGDPYVVHTNVILQGKGGKEQEFYLWFDPTKDFHLYSIVWNPKNIILLVDEVPIRVYRNWGTKGVRYPSDQPMKMYATLWDAEDWATQGGRVKTDWSKAPFIASYKGYNASACVWPSSSSNCPSSSPTPGNEWQSQTLGVKGRNMLRWVQKKYMIYNYCTDFKRYPRRLPRECRKSRFL